MMTALAVEAIERRLLPDAMVRAGIRRLCGERLRDAADDARSGAEARFLSSMRTGPVAPVPDKANEQHYEVPAAFYRLALGPHYKYSSGYWGDADDPAPTLAEAERRALDATVAHADLHDGMSILELGCGWGSLTLWMAERFLRSRIVAVSNSASQRRHIESQLQDRGLTNVEVRTEDMNDFDPGARFDRIVSVEMFEHMRNYEVLLQRVRSWLNDDGRVLVHVFCHRTHTYPFDVEGASNWMGRHFFTGGIMPAADVFRHFDRDLRVEEQWRWDGTHYARTARAWLDNLDRHRKAAMPILRATYGRDASRWLARWRIFFMACEELFAYDGGREWLVTHVRLAPVTTGTAS